VLKDPFRALVSGGACERLDAVQQMDGGLPREANYSTTEAQAYLRGALCDSDSRVRFWAAAAVGDLQHRGAVPALIERLRDPDLWVRYRAARSLGMLGDAAALQPLQDRVRNDIWYVADYARAAFRQITIQRGGQ
jgi:HEAT repeat protein